MSLFSFRAARIPRAIPYYRWLWVGAVIWAIATTGALGWGGWMAWQNHLFADHARHVIGKVEQKYVTTSQSKSGIHYHYHVSYSYDAEGMTFSDSDTLPRYNWDELTIGGQIPIKFLPENPGDNRIDNTAKDYNYDLDAKIGLVIGLVSLVVGTVGFVSGFKRNGLQRRLVTSGISCQGLVEAVRTERVGKATMIFVHFNFTDNYGRVIEGRTWPLKRSLEGRWATRKTLPVFFDPRNSTVFTVDLDS